MSDHKQTYLVTIEVRTTRSGTMTDQDVRGLITADPPKLDVVGAGSYGPLLVRRGVYTIKSGRVVTVVPTSSRPMRSLPKRITQGHAPVLEGEIVTDI